MNETCGNFALRKNPYINSSYSFNTGKLNYADIEDYAVVGSLMAILCIIGAYHAWIDRDDIGAMEFLMAGRTINLHTVSFAMIGTNMSAIVLLGLPAEIYNYGTMLMWLFFAHVLVIMATVFLYLPAFLHLQLMSTFEYLQARFSKRLRTYASCIYVLSQVVCLPVTLFAPCLAVSKVFGLPLYTTVVSISVCCIFYTASGGLKSILWNGVIHALVITISLVILLFFAFQYVGPWKEVWEVDKLSKRAIFSESRFNPTIRYSSLTMTLGYYFTVLLQYGVNQTQLLTAMACQNLQSAQIAFLMSSFGTLALLYMLMFIGIYMSAFYIDCDPQLAGLIHRSDELFPLFAMDLLGNTPGLPGVFLASIISGAMSSVSLSLHAVTSVIFEDLIQSHTGHLMNLSKTRFFVQILTSCVGLCILSLIMAGSALTDYQLTIFAVGIYIGAPITALFSLGLFLPWANSFGAIIGFSVSLLLMLMCLVQMIFNGTYKPTTVRCVTACHKAMLSNNTVLTMTTPRNQLDADWISFSGTQPPVTFWWYGVVAYFSCIIIGVIFSSIKGFNDPQKMHPYLVVVLGNIYPFKKMPENIRKSMRFGMARHSIQRDSVATIITTTKSRPSTETRSLSFRTSTRSTSFRTSTKSLPGSRLRVSKSKGATICESDSSLESSFQTTGNSVNPPVLHLRKASRYSLGSGVPKRASNYPLSPRDLPRGHPFRWETSTSGGSMV